MKRKLSSYFKLFTSISTRICCFFIIKTINLNGFHEINGMNDFKGKLSLQWKFSPKLDFDEI